MTHHRRIDGSADALLFIIVHDRICHLMVGNQTSSKGLGVVIGTQNKVFAGVLKIKLRFNQYHHGALK